MVRPDVKVEIAFNSTYSTPAASRTWTDVTEYVKTAEGISISHARQDEFSQPGPNTCSLTLKNADGRFTPGLATSPYYPNVKIGRPLRVAVNLCTHGTNGTFEANATGWAGINASVAQSTAQAHSGSASLRVTATAAGDMSANAPAGTAGIPVVAGVTYRASAWFRSSGTSRTTTLRVLWYDAAGTLLSTSVSPSITDTGTWQLVEFSVTAPASAAYARPRGFWTAAGAGEIHYIDDVRLDSDRFVGYVDEWPLEWPATVSTWATSTISATSRMARLGLSAKFKSVIEEEILADSPVAYYTLGEASGATQANDSSGHDVQPLRMAGTGADVTFGSAAGPSTDSLTAGSFEQWGKALRATNGAVMPGSLTQFTVETFVLVNGAAKILAVLPPGELEAGSGAERPGYGYFTLRTTSGGWPTVEFIDTSEVADEIFDSTSISGEIAHLAVTFTNGGAMRLYVNGAERASATVGNWPTLAQDFVVGLVVTGATGPLAVAHVAVYDTVLSADRIAVHADAGLDGFATEAAHERLARYARWAGIPSTEYSFSTAALTPMAHIDTAEKSAVDLKQAVATTDGGVLYDSRGGVLTYVDRAVRYNAAAVLTLDAAAGEVEVGYAPKVDRSALINRVTATTSDGSYSVVAEDATSINEYGTHDPGGIDLATTDHDEAHAAAHWRVNTYREPAARAPQLAVELAKMSAARQAAVLAVKVSDKITVTGLPSQSDATSKSFFVEGYTERITDSQHFVDFNVSPGAGFEVFEIGHATYGQYDAYPIAY